MKLLKLFSILILLQNCSFDNKSGIWKNENLEKVEKSIFKDFETIKSLNKKFDQIIPIKKITFLIYLHQLKITNGVIYFIVKIII